MPPSSQHRPAPAGPPVRIEVRHGSTPPVAFDVPGDEFLIGSVPGCDLRLPGSNLPPNICLLRRGPDGVRIRKLAPALPILLNGTPLPPAGSATLRHGDVVSVGAVDLHLAIDTVHELTPITFDPAVDHRARELDARAAALDEQARELESDRVLWYERRQEIESEIRAAREEIALSRRKPQAPPVDLTEVRTQIRRELADEYRDRREELDRLQLAVREAAVQLQERKQQFEDGQRRLDPRTRELADKERAVAARHHEIETGAAELKRLREAFEADRQVAEMRLAQREQDLARREIELAARETAAHELNTTAGQDRAQYQADLVRVDRLSAALETKERALTERAADIDRRYDQFQKDMADFEEHVRLFDEREDRAKAIDVRLAAREAALDARDRQLTERAATLETQQGTLVALRTKLEQVRDDLRAQEMAVADERARMTAQVEEARDRLRQAEAIREQLDAEKDGHVESARQTVERTALMTQAVERLRAMQDGIAAEGERLQQFEADLTAKAAAQAELAEQIQARTEQLAAAEARGEADRLALREREAALKEAEDTREALQEQLRLRSEELIARQREMEERTARLDEQAGQLSAQLTELEAFQAEANSVRRLTDEEAAILAGRDERLTAAEQMVADQRRELDEARAKFEQDQADAEERLAAARAEIEQLKDALSARTTELLGQMPDLEHRAQAALDRTAQARESMRAQLAELHAYALKSQEDLQTIRGEVQDELGRLREQEQVVNRARSEHRLGVSSFRQQLIEWQARFAELKQALHHGEVRLDRREKQVEATEQHLATKAEELQQVEQEVTEKRTEVDKHLGDMRAWYRQKFREIAETRWSKYRTAGTGESGILPLPPRPDGSTPHSSLLTPHSEEVILPLPDDLDPADRRLGELLRSLDIIDRDTLPALWDEARRQRRTLRQVLLAGGYLTLYQLALIESGNLSGLMLGRFRVIDRLLSTPREAVYRVFDPQLGATAQELGTCLLRHLGESEMLDAVRPDEYRQRFSAARDLAHPNVAGTLEVLEVNGRPAIVQEWLHGLPGSEWPAAVASPGVWHRVLLQAALGLQAAHSVGLTHGRLTANSFLLTRPGVVKLVGVGEPPWLHPGGPDRDATPEEDLRALGVVAAQWMQTGSRRRLARPKPFPAGLQDILRSLGITPTEGGVPLAVYPSAAALLEDLDRVAAEVPADTGTWEKLLEYAAENGGDGIVLRQSA
jgi:chromosome segregation ATPase